MKEKIKIDMRDYLEENNINVGDYFVFTSTECGDKIYRLITRHRNCYYYDVRETEILPQYGDNGWGDDLNHLHLPLMFSFHKNSLYAKSCMKFDREEEIDKLLC